MEVKMNTHLFFVRDCPDISLYFYCSITRSDLQSLLVEEEVCVGPQELMLLG